MISQITPHFVDLVHDAALKSFWRKRTLTKFLERCDIRNLPVWPDGETKRNYLETVLSELFKNDEGRTKILQMAIFLIDQTSFNDLSGWEDSKEKLEDAEAAVASLKAYHEEQQAQIKSKKEKKEAREKSREYQELVRKSQSDLQSLMDSLSSLASEIGTPEAGHAFEDWFYELAKFSEIPYRKPYKTSGREIDGSLTIGDTTYLVELKFTTSQSSAQEIDIFKGKLEDKADNTMGVFFSMSGFSSVAIQQASGKKTPLLLFDHRHIYRVIGGAMSLKEVIERVRRHASQTGDAYLPIERFDG